MDQEDVNKLISKNCPDWKSEQLRHENKHKRKKIMKQYCFEIYTINAETKETGWDIEHIVVLADDADQAREKIKNYPLFDCIITMNDWYGYRDGKWPVFDGQDIIEQKESS